MRGRPIGVRLTDAERVRLDELAAAYGMTAAEFMRHRSLGYRLPPTQAAEQVRAKLATALMRLGVNLNQIARAANIGRQPSEAVLIDLLAQVNAHLDQLYDPRPD